MNPDISRQDAHELLEALLLFKSAREEVRCFRTVINEFQAQLTQAESARQTALAKRSEFLSGIGPDAPWDDDIAMIAVLEGYKETEENCADLRLTIQGQEKLLAEAELRLEARKVERTSKILKMNGQVDI